MLMKERIKTIVAFSILAAITVAGFYLDVRDQSADVYPDENTTIMLYGEAHGDCIKRILSQWITVMYLEP